jgi:hypothetical protein
VATGHALFHFQPSERILGPRRTARYRRTRHPLVEFRRFIFSTQFDVAPERQRARCEALSTLIDLGA